METHAVRNRVLTILGLILAEIMIFSIIYYYAGLPLSFAAMACLFFLFLFLFISFIKSCMVIVPEYERLVIFRLGKCKGPYGPGIVFVWPFIEQVVPVDTRERFHEVSHEACITKDNAKINVDFLFYWKIVDPVWSQTRVQKLEDSLEGLATGLLRAVIGLFPLDDALAERERINEELKDKLEEVSEHWGVMVTTVEIREIIPPEDIQDAMHKQLAAERKRRAEILEAQGKRESDILRAEGESLALERLTRTAKEIDPKTLQLKYLEALTDVGKSDSTKYIFPLEFTQFLKPFLQGQTETNTFSPDEMNAIMKALADVRKNGDKN